ncbi:GNAT family N-acetyltransferase [Tabrizicola sp.]|uniref:GNAT family N-acetyltransferase n=1 Tax=Tabrizicola sp. TaxID=2005166 RepID=UPI00286AF5AA|nr:GNAT family N-acetyltransferase [Tabrizicola sp.]
MTVWPPRPAVAEDIEPLIMVWHHCWHEAHAAITPPALVALRTPDLFAKRLENLGNRLRVAGPTGAPLGLCIIKANHLDQLYVAKEARGTGLAAALLRDGEARLSATGITNALLDCAARNHRAARFYTREGWVPLVRTTVPAEATDPPLQIEVIQFGKRLAGFGVPIGGGAS